MFSQFRPALVSLLVLTAITGMIYPAMVTGIANLAFANQAGGSVIEQDGKAIGSTLIAQPFTDPAYFWPRPSAASYNASASSGSNLGPANPALSEAVRQRIAALKQADPDNDTPIPVDLMTASGSGLDPHISIAAARYQIGRVARARHMAVRDLENLVNRFTEGRAWGLLGEPIVNVLRLNLALKNQ